MSQDKFECDIQGMHVLHDLPGDVVIHYLPQP